MMKKEMAKHQERYTLLDELALGEEKEDEKKRKGVLPTTNLVQLDSLQLDSA
jgi:hypothetical protein